MLTRIAGNCYWMARQLERAENNARLLRMAACHALTPEGQEDEAGLWKTALEVGGTLDAFQERGLALDPGAVMLFMVLDQENPSGIVSCLRAARDNARTARHLLTDVSWEAMNRTWAEAVALDETRIADMGAEGVVDWTIRRCRLVRGCFEDLWRDALPHVLDLGESAERADFTARILAEMLPSLLAEGSGEPAIGSPLFRRWQRLLTGLGLMETWRRSTANQMTPLAVLRLVLLHPHDPHSLLVAVRRMGMAVIGATGREEGRALAAVRRLEGTLLAADLEEMLAGGMAEFCSGLTAMTNEIGARVMKDHLS